MHVSSNAITHASDANIHCVCFKVADAIELGTTLPNRIKTNTGVLADLYQRAQRVDRFARGSDCKCLIALSRYAPNIESVSARNACRAFVFKIE